MSIIYHVSGPGANPEILFFAFGQSQSEFGGDLPAVEDVTIGLSELASDDRAGGIEPGQRADITVIDPEKTGVIDPDAFYSMGRATPFEGWETTGDIRLTMQEGHVVWTSEKK